MSGDPTIENKAFRKGSYLHHVSDPDEKNIAIFSHLEAQDEDYEDEGIHWAIKDLKDKIQLGHIVGGNARCKAMLEALKIFIKEYNFPRNRAANRDLEDKIDHFINYVKKSRPLSFGMETAVKYLKLKINKIPLDAENYSDFERKVKIWLGDQIKGFIRDKIELPLSIIATKASDIIKDGDVILIYGCSSAVLASLIKAKELGRQFKVIISDSRPHFEGKKSCDRLIQAEINCTYILISSISYHMIEVTRVFLGASGLTTNGFLLSRAGTALVCCVANAFKKPVLVCTETYKFSEKVQIDAICYNEIGNSDELVSTQFYPGDVRLKPTLIDWKNQQNLNILNLKYDLTPAQYIDMLVTEVGCIPVTSVPVVLREFSLDAQQSDNKDPELEILLNTQAETKAPELNTV